MVPGYRASVRLRLTLSYAGFLLAAGAAALMGVYVVLRFVPNYPLTFANPRDSGVPIASRQEILSAVVTWSAVILVALAVIGLAGGWWLAGRVLRPLTDLREAARTVANGRLDYRIRLRGPRDEFAEVADSFDHMLDRLSDAFAAQERFSANAAHELRTPLAVSRTILDVALAAPDGGGDRQALERLSQTTDRAIELTEALLRLADANELTARHVPVDLAAVVEDALTDVGDEAAERGIAVETAVTPAPVVGDPTLLRQLTVNLLQNGVRHNRVGGGLWLRTYVDASRAWIEVESDGAALSPAAVARFVEPYLRGAGRTTTAAGPRGHGLGLALVDRIVRVHRGRLTLEPRAAGGLRVLVELPRGSVETRTAGT